MWIATELASPFYSCFTVLHREVPKMFEASLSSWLCKLACQLDLKINLSHSPLWLVLPCLLSILTFQVVNNSSKLNQLVFIDPVPSLNAVVALLCFWIASVNQCGLEVINLKERSLSVWNPSYIKITLDFSIVLCLPFVFHRASFPSMVIHPSLASGLIFLILIFYILSAPRRIQQWYDWHVQLPTVQYWAGSIILFLCLSLCFQ